MVDGEHEARLYPRLTHDLVVVVPGIMGSALYDVDRDRPLWGASLPLLFRSWTDGAPLRHLALDERETAGEYGRVRPTGLLAFPEYLPFLRGAGPYTAMVAAVRESVVDPRAVVKFAYDWRLPVTYNAGLLTRTVLERLDTWRATNEHRAAQRRHPRGRPAQVVIVAHSMGGLLAREFAAAPGCAELLRAVVTVGTPFHGSPKAAAIISNGEYRVKNVPVLPARRPLTSLLRTDPDNGVRALAATLPGLYDLLPRYRCVDDGADGRHLTSADVVDLGGDPAQAEAWAERHAGELGPRERGASPITAAHRLIVGSAQPTAQSLRLAAGAVTLLDHDLRPGHPDRFGDGTVPTGSAEITDLLPDRHPQSHQGLATADGVLRDVKRILREVDPDELGPALGPGDGIGIDPPDVTVPAGTVWPVAVRGIGRPVEITATVTDLTGSRRPVSCPVEPRDGVVTILLRPGAPGLHRLDVTSRSGRISEFVLVREPDDRR